MGIFCFKDNDESNNNRELKKVASSTQGCVSALPPARIKVNKDAITTRILKRQASYAGSHPAQESAYANLPEDCLEKIHASLLKAFGIL